MNGVDRRVRWAGLAACLLVLAVFGMLNYIQVFHASALVNSPLNTSGVIERYSQPRGAIVSADGVTLAQSVPVHDQYKYHRIYPEGALFAQITGYDSLIYGTDGLEREYNSVLSQSSPVTLPRSLRQLEKFFTHQPGPDDLHITVLANLQKLARQQLAGRDGAVVALDPKTGAILAMYSNPSYNPGPLASHKPSVVEKAWHDLTTGPGQPLVAAAYRQRFFPGSTFKIVTAAAVYDHKPALANKAYPVSTGFVLPDTAGQILHNFAGEACGGQMLELFTVSCDTGFAQLGLGVGANALLQEARDFGWDQPTPLDLPGVAESYFPQVSSFYRNAGALAKSAIGQESVQAVPLTLALDAGAVADKGVIMTPHLMSYVSGGDGQVVARYKDKAWRRATSPATAAKLRKLMLSVVASPNGTGVTAQIPGVEVAGKTGTAQTGGPNIETWFVAFAPAEDPKIAVCVLVENQPQGTEYQGATIAAPIAKAVIESYLQPRAGASS